MKLSVESQYEKHLDDIARCIADCVCRRQKGICSKEDCESCSTYTITNKCYNCLTDADKLHVDVLVDRYVPALSRTRYVSYTTKQCVKDSVLAFIGIILVETVIIFMALAVLGF